MKKIIIISIITLALAIAGILTFKFTGNDNAQNPSEETIEIQENSNVDQPQGEEIKEESEGESTIQNTEENTSEETKEGTSEEKNELNKENSNI